MDRNRGPFFGHPPARVGALLLVIHVCQWLGPPAPPTNPSAQRALCCWPSPVQLRVMIRWGVRGGQATDKRGSQEVMRPLSRADDRKKAPDFCPSIINSSEGGVSDIFPKSGKIKKSHIFGPTYTFRAVVGCVYSCRSKGGGTAV